MALKFALSFLLLPFLANAMVEYNPRRYINMNHIDRCWRSNLDWDQDQQQLTMCSVGFSRRMKQNRGKKVTFYEVTDSSDHPTHPKEGTLRYATSEIPGKVWITFKYDMCIKLERPVFVSNYTVIDGRGANVHINERVRFLLYQVSNVIIHGLHFHDIKKTSGSLLAIKGGKQTDIGNPEGYDAIRVVGSSKLWIDHNSFSNAQDGLIDITLGSSRITISNNWFTYHDKVMLLGADDKDSIDRNMRVTIVYNRFGPHSHQRMPRIRNGYVRIANNLFDGWKQYAIGGSHHPTILSESKRFVSSGNAQILWKQSGELWHVKSRGDEFINGSSFMHQNEDDTTPRYGALQSFMVGGVESLDLLIQDAGALSCRKGKFC